MVTEQGFAVLITCKNSQTGHFFQQKPFRNRHVRFSTFHLVSQKNSHIFIFLGAYMCIMLEFRAKLTKRTLHDFRFQQSRKKYQTIEKFLKFIEQDSHVWVIFTESKSQIYY